jgi:glycine/D-amino acid oxidase-like deaminating enzyme
VKVQARDVIVATCFPVFDKPGLYFTRLYPKKSYVAAVKTNQLFPKEMYIDAEDSGLAWRAQPVTGGEIIVVTGGNHKAGEGDSRAEYEKLGRDIRSLYSDASVEFSWSTQDNVTSDGLPYIGHMNPLGKNIWVATGFAQWGMTPSVVAGQILTDLIQGRSNPWAEVYNPNRFHIDRSIAKG